MEEEERDGETKKEAAMKEAMPQIEPDVVEQVERTAHYPIMKIVTTMRISAMMLELADRDNLMYSKLNLMQANLLRAAARDLAAQYEAQLAEIKKIAESLLGDDGMSKTWAMAREFFEKEHDEPGSL